MKQQKLIGITIFALIGMFYGILLLFFSVLLLLPKGKLIFAGILGLPPHKFYINIFIFFIMGVCFLISSIALLKRKIWSKTFFLLVVLSNVIMNVKIFSSGIGFNRTRGITLITLEDVLELALSIAFLLAVFWYFNRGSVRDCFASKKSVTVQAPE